MRRAIPGLVAVLAVVLVGCGSNAVAPLPKPPKVSVVPTQTTLPDFSNVALDAVSGTTTTVGARGIRGGAGAIRGRVTVGGSGVANATVRIERFEGDTSSGSIDVVSGADGSYGVDGINGGRYRVRAFRAPDLTMPTATALFLGATERRSLDLALQSFNGGTTVNASVSPSPPILGGSGVLSVSVLTKGVDSGGTARSIGVPGVAVFVTTAGGKALTSANPAVTSGNGVASFTFVCAALDRQGLSITIPGGAPVSVAVSACDLPPTTTTVLLPTDTAVPLTTTTTSGRRR